MPVIEFPVCFYCKIPGGEVFKCKRCGQFSHSECLVEITDADRCTHKAYRPATGDSWEIPLI